MPWDISRVDLVGPWSVKTPSGVKNLRAFTTIDIGTGWFEISDIPTKEARTVMDTFHYNWLDIQGKFK
jgi:hypothetical protein